MQLRHCSLRNKTYLCTRNKRVTNRLIQHYNMTLPKLHSITKKIMVAVLGGFLLIFLLFHMSANLLILLNDGGSAYSAFCHFMGKTIAIRVMEVVLFGALLLHAVVALWLAATNRMSRPVGYHKPQKSKTHTTSKLMMWSGILIFVCLIMHFYDFYMVKIGLVKGEYMVKTEKLQDEEMSGIMQLANQMQMTPSDLVAAMKEEMATMGGDDEEANNYIESITAKIKVMDIVNNAYTNGNISADKKWIHRLNAEEKAVIKEAFPDSDVEPDFYYMARKKFKVWHIVLGYLVFFAVLFVHLTHAFPSAFQTLGLNNYKYNHAIEICGKIYTWVVCLGFAVIPIVIFLSE